MRSHRYRHERIQQCHGSFLFSPTKLNHASANSIFDNAHCTQSGDSEIVNVTDTDTQSEQSVNTAGTSFRERDISSDQASACHTVNDAGYSYSSDGHSNRVQTPSTCTDGVHRHYSGYQSSTIGECHARQHRDDQSSRIGECHTRQYRDDQTSTIGKCHTRQYRDDQSSRRGQCHTRQYRDDQSSRIGKCHTRQYRDDQSSRIGQCHTRQYRDEQCSRIWDCHARQYRDDQRGRKGYFQGSNKLSLVFYDNSERFSQSRFPENSWSQTQGYPSCYHTHISNSYVSSHRNGNRNSNRSACPGLNRNSHQDYRKDHQRNNKDGHKMSYQHTSHYPYSRGSNRSWHYQKRYESKDSETMRNPSPACRRRGMKSNGNTSYRKRLDDVKRRNRDSENVQNRSSVTENNSGEYLSGSALSFSGFSASSDILHSPEKKQFFKPAIFSTRRDQSIASKPFVRCLAETQQQKDNKDSPLTFSGLSSSNPCIYSVSKLLLNGYQRGEVGKSKLHRTLILSSASNLTHTDSCCVFNSPQMYETLENMTYMEKNKDHDRLLCMWSFSGAAMQQIQLVNVKERTKTQCGELALELSQSDTVLQSWSKITSLCWVDSPLYSSSSHVLYTTTSHSNNVMSVAYIRPLDPSSGMILSLDFLLDDRKVCACAWNSPKEQFGVGLLRECRVVDVTTRQFWKFDTHGGHVLTQAFSKADGGNLLFSGIHRGSVLMHDLRRESSKPVKLLIHRKDICHLKLSSDEYYIYASDIAGQIKKWDLRMRRMVINYEGLCNRYQRLPFHIDDTQSVLYAAGSDCHTNMWCLQSGQLLQSIPPPYKASPNTVPAIQFSSQWTGVPSNMGLIMGAGMNFHLYSSTL